MLKILVVGDSMMDRYWYGDVSRLSQEAPVPVVKHLREERRAGAAGNVARNCVSMGADASLLSIVGNDEYGKHFADLVPCSTLIYDWENGTTQKLRIIGRQQQITRIDFDHAPSNNLADQLRDQFFLDVMSSDIIVFSDYGKGTLKHIRSMINMAKNFGKTVLVDPKGHNYDKYRGADLIKPNIDEMRELVGGWDDEVELGNKAQALIRQCGFKAVLLTRAADGMTLFMGGCDPVHVPSMAHEVFDVCGAGDVAISAFAVALAKGFDYMEATHYSAKASGLSVGYFGTVAINEKDVF
jgi:rfaE bifunctional protein kinase chain/domain